MAIQNKIAGGVSNTLADVDAGNNLKVTLPTDHLHMGGALQFNENDSGEITGQKFFFSPEVDTDYRQRVSQDLMLDDEAFNYVTQNTGKHVLNASTMAGLWSIGQFTTNTGNITTINTGLNFYTYASFPVISTQTLSCDMEIGFSNQPVSNTFIEFGFQLGLSPTSSATDGCYFRLSSAGLQGIVTNSSTETSTGVFPATEGTGTWTYTNNKKYQFICYLGGVAAYFWVNDGTGARLLGTIPLPSGQARMVSAGGLQFMLKHRIVGGVAGGVIQAQLGAYSIRLGGSNTTSTLSTQSNRMYGSYQGFGGGTQGSLANYSNSANPTAAVPTNTTAALGTGLGGQFWETATLAVNTDGIICSYQVPPLSSSLQGKRLVIRGVALSSYIQTAITGAPFIAQYSLAFGHTAVSLATAESATTKMPRRVALPFTQAVTAAQAASTLVTQSENFCDFGDAPIFVNQGEFIALVTKHVGTVATAGVIAHTVTFIYGWE